MHPSHRHGGMALAHDRDALGAGHEGPDNQVIPVDVRPEHPERIGVAGRGQAIERGGADRAHDAAPLSLTGSPPVPSSGRADSQVLRVASPGRSPGPSSDETPEAW